MAKDAGVPLKDAERYWLDAEQSAEDQGRKDDYRFIMGIVKARLQNAKQDKKEWDYPMDTHMQEHYADEVWKGLVTKHHGKVTATAGSTLTVEFPTQFDADGFHTDLVRNHVPVTVKMDYNKPRPLAHLDMHEEITTTANLGTNTIAQTKPMEDAPFVCASCGYGSDKDEGGTCPKCGGRMTARESWIRELIARVEAGEAPREVLGSVLK